jgi:hypothetical protein
MSLIVHFSDASILFRFKLLISLRDTTSVKLSSSYCIVSSTTPFQFVAGRILRWPHDLETYYYFHDFSDKW